MGECINKISPEYKVPKSIQETSSFAPSTNDVDYLKNELNKHIKDACRKLRKHNVKTFQVGVMLRTKDFMVYSDKKNLECALNLELEISKHIFQLFENIYNSNLLYRSSGVYFANLSSENFVQGGFFSDDLVKKSDNLSKTIDKIEAKFGKGSIKTGFV